MVSKGLDFDHVSVVGILNADTMLNYPDFRSYERAFQLMAQVAGRAGRKNKRGRVVLQTKSIDHPIIRQVMTNDYEDMVAGQLAEAADVSLSSVLPDGVCLSEKPERDVA